MIHSLTLHEVNVLLCIEASSAFAAACRVTTLPIAFSERVADPVYFECGGMAMAHRAPAG